MLLRNFKNFFSEITLPCGCGALYYGIKKIELKINKYAYKKLEIIINLYNSSFVGPFYIPLKINLI